MINKTLTFLASTHDMFEAFRHLVKQCDYYARFSKSPNSDQYAKWLAAAAVAFTAQLAVELGENVGRTRDLEQRLMAALTTKVMPDAGDLT